VSADNLTAKVALNGGGGWNPDWEADLSRFESDPFIGTPSSNGHPADFSGRVAATRVDLLQRIRQGIPAIDYLPASEEMLVRAKRHQIAAPKKEGKSITMLVHWVAMAVDGARVVILDRENGADLYASRLEAIIAAFELDEAEQELLAENLVYYEFPRLRLDDGDQLAALCAGADIVVFDSQRMFLTDLGLAEDKSDDYARFVGVAVDPLFRAGIATMILDNTGHQEPKRSRGSSSKGDLNEIIFTLEAVEPFDLATVGKARLEVSHSRFGNTGRWDMTIGGGTFTRWQRVDKTDAQEPRPAFFPTGLMERASRYLELIREPASRNAIERNIEGKSTTYKRLAIDRLTSEGYCREIPGPRGARLIELLKPFREADFAPTSPQATDSDLASLRLSTSPQEDGSTKPNPDLAPDLAPPRPETAATTSPLSESSPTGNGEEEAKSDQRRAALFDEQFPPKDAA
jgi:hypothetical protein